MTTAMVAQLVAAGMSLWAALKAIYGCPECAGQAKRASANPYPKSGLLIANYRACGASYPTLKPFSPPTRESGCCWMRSIDWRTRRKS